MRDSERNLSVPCVDDAPSDVAELVESAALQRLTFRCNDCDSAIGRIIDVTGGHSPTGTRTGGNR